MVSTALQSQLKGINKLLSQAYDPDVRLSTLIAGFGYDKQQLLLLKEEYLGQVVSSFLNEARDAMVSRSGDDRLYRIICRRYGLDGAEPGTLQAVGEDLGISRERVRQLEAKALKRCRSVYRSRWETGLRSAILRLIGPGRAAGHAGEPRAFPDEAVPPLSGDLVSTSRGEEHQAAAIIIGARSILEEVPGGLRRYLLAHILAGDPSPVVRALVGHYRLEKHFGAFQDIGYQHISQVLRLALPTPAGHRKPSGSQAGGTHDLSHAPDPGQTVVSNPAETGLPTRNQHDPWQARLAQIRGRYPRAYEP